jgi:hypothetical protein
MSTFIGNGYFLLPKINRCRRAEQFTNLCFVSRVPINFAGLQDMYVFIGNHFPFERRDTMFSPTKNSPLIQNDEKRKKLLLL